MTLPGFIEETCSACCGSGAGSGGGLCPVCVGRCRVARHAFSEESAIGGPTDEERQIESLRRENLRLKDLAELAALLNQQQADERERIETIAPCLHDWVNDPTRMWAQKCTVCGTKVDR